MNMLPRAPHFDATISWYRDPYRFISSTCESLKTDIFQARFLLQPTIFMRGAEAAKLFYASDRVMRRGAAVARVQKTLTGRSGVQGLDDQAHRHRKALFLSLTDPHRLHELGNLVRKAWSDEVHTWKNNVEIDFYERAKQILMRAICQWAWVPLPEQDVVKRTHSMSALYEYAGSIGLKHWWARVARHQSEQWMQELIIHVRDGKLTVPADSALAIFSTARDHHGQLLSLDAAAVEVLNIIRPTVAVAVYFVHALHALHLHPHCRLPIAEGGAQGETYLFYFIQEVRRWYPFFPATMARCREDFIWNDFQFKKHQRVIFDLYGTNHDPKLWEKPEQFRPERFSNWQENNFSFVPQGGGDYQTNHRCPGEPIAIELMRVTILFFINNVTYLVPEQNLQLNYAHMPALPASHLRIVKMP